MAVTCVAEVCNPGRAMSNPPCARRIRGTGSTALLQRRGCCRGGRWRRLLLAGFAKIQGNDKAVSPRCGCSREDSGRQYGRDAVTRPLPRRFRETVRPRCPGEAGVAKIQGKPPLGVLPGRPATEDSGEWHGEDVPAGRCHEDSGETARTPLPVSRRFRESPRLAACGMPQRARARQIGLARHEETQKRSVASSPGASGW